MFPETQWTVLSEATLHGGGREQRALGEFYTLYLPPVRACLQRQGLRGAALEDMVQDFFLDLMQRSVPRRADPAKGKFRTFLQLILQRFLLRRLQYDQQQKRCGGEAADPGPEIESVPGESAPVEEVLDYEWALHLLQRAVTALEARWQIPGRSTRWELLRRYLPGAADPPDPAETREALQCSDAAVRQMVSRLRREFTKLLRAEVAVTVSSPEELEQELQYLGRLLRAAPAHAVRADF